MNKLFRALFGAVLAALVLSPFYAGAAEAASLTVAVQQVGSNSTAQTVTCAAMQQNCVLPLVINAGQPTQQSLNIGVGFVTDGMILNFQSPQGYFYADDTGDTVGVYNTMWAKKVQGSAPATYQVTLFQPLSPTKLTRILSVAGEAKLGIAHPSVANLQITATPVP